MPPSPLSISPHSLKSRKVRATVEKRGREEKETEDANERLHVNLNEEEKGKTRFFERRRGRSANFRERPPYNLRGVTFSATYVLKLGERNFHITWFRAFLGHAKSSPQGNNRRRRRRTGLFRAAFFAGNEEIHLATPPPPNPEGTLRRTEAFFFLWRRAGEPLLKEGLN